MKITQINGWDKLGRAVKFKINSSFLAVSTMYVTLKKKINKKMKFQSFVNFPKKIKEIIKMFSHF